MSNVFKNQAKKEEAPLADALTTAQVVVAEPFKQKTENVHFDGVAYSLMYTEGRYHMIEVPFNTVSLVSGPARITHSDGSKYEIMDRFKITSQDLLDVLY